MTGRTIPSQLVNHLGQAATTVCRLFKVTAVGDYSFGLTSLDRDIEYDDGDGLLLYKAKRGYNPYSVETASDLSVDNSEMQVLLAEFDLDGFTYESITRGVYDDARFIEYGVNYQDLSQGHVILNSGSIGQVRVIDGLLCFPEMRSLTQSLKQKSIIEKGSNNCRAVHGDERCKFPVETLWTDRGVTSVGVESDRVFTINGAIPDDNDYKPGLFEWFTGDNAGRTFEIESNDGAVITLAMPTDRPIQVGDTGRIRRACTNLWEGPNSCEFYETLRPGQRLDFRGEPHRPVADTASLMVPKPSRTE